MASSIDTTKPTTGAASTADVRANFTSAKSEIETLQTDVALRAPIASPTFTGTATLPTAAVTTFTFGGVTVTATAAELNKLDGVTASTAEINHLVGVTSAIQTQLDAKQASGSYAAASHTHTKSDITDFSDGDYATAAQGTTADSAVQPNDAATLASITLGTWTISDSAGKLIFSNGSTRFSISAAGAIIAGDDITAFGTP